ncbi:NIL domain-containing protein [Nostoc sp. 106C]|uniref:NIL domain-containing protein n=1 Tax=Nostoc sp. 106C TaxID=1932667 RepID=UPI000A39FD62|nr:NIL domain-containing protein [Nostoc sp. 106C]OUL22120.1 NIL domain-containing protein [Nostoc sp. 106C]
MSPDKSQKSSPVHSRILVPQRYHRQPVISRLISRYGLTINITAASLVSDSESDGWFDLELLGNPQQLTSSLSYLQGLGVNLVELAIANQIQSDQHSQPFPNSPNKVITSQCETLKSQWTEEFQAWISQGQTNRLRLQMCILKTYYEKPVISQLVSRYGLTVNITSAFLNPDMQDDGWFDLDLWGRTRQIYSSLSYLKKLGLPIWPDWSSTVRQKFLE